MSIIIKVPKRATTDDYISLATEIDKWFTDDCSSCSFGDTNQTFGWGGTILPSVTPGQQMTGAQMNELIDRLNIAVGITSVSGTLSRLNPADSVLPSTFNEATSKESLVPPQKNLIEVSELSQISGTSDSRTTSYTSAVNTTFRYTFSNFDEARYFFQFWWYT